MIRLLTMSVADRLEVRIEIEPDGKIVVLVAGSRLVEPEPEPVPAEQIVL